MSVAAKPAPYDPKPTEANNPLGTVALVLGIVGLFSGCPVSLAAMITGWMGMKKEPSGMARVGFWLGAAATILQTIVLVIVLLFFGAALGVGLTSVEVERFPDSPTDEAAPFVIERSEPPEIAVPEEIIAEPPPVGVEEVSPPAP